MEQHDQVIAYTQEASRGLPGSFKQVADFLLAEGTGIAQLTMAEIAARAYTSKPSLVRFAKRAGYDGWKDYRHDFLVAMEELEARRASEAKVDVNYPFAAGAPVDEVVGSLRRIGRLASEELERKLDLAALDRAAEALVGARTIAYLGAMQNYQRGKIFASNLALIGYLCWTPGTDEAAALARHLGPGDCVVVASYSGGLGHVPMTFVPQIKQRGATVIAITNSQRSSLGDTADHLLAYAPLEHYHAKIAAFYSGTCTSLILDALYASCYAKRFDESSASRHEVVEGLRGYIPEDFDHPR